MATTKVRMPTTLDMVDRGESCWPLASMVQLVGAWVEEALQAQSTS